MILGHIVPVGFLSYFHTLAVMMKQASDHNVCGNKKDLKSLKLGEPCTNHSTTEMDRWLVETVITVIGEHCELLLSDR